MAKNEVVATEEKTTALTTDEQAFVVDVDPTDMMIPFLKVVQSLSEEVVPGKEKYNPDVRPGDIYDSVTRTVIKDASCVICGLKKYFAEWTPEVRGTLIGKHRSDSPKVLGAQKITRTTDKGTEFTQLRTIDGNDLIETYGVVLLIKNGDGVIMPGVITLSKTSFMVGKNLAATLAFKQSTGVPNFKLTTTNVSNSKGSWFKPVFTVDGYVTDADMLITANQLRQIADKLIFNTSVAENDNAIADIDNELL